MGLTVTVKGDGGVNRYEFSALNLAQFIAALYNHQSNPQENTQLSVAQAQQQIQKFEGSRQIQLHRLKNDAGHQRNLGMTIEGAWKGNAFTPTQITINEQDFLKGGISKQARRRGKNLKDAKPLGQLVEALHQQNKAPEINVPRSKLKEKPPRIKQKSKQVKREMSPSLQAALDRGLFGADSPELNEEKPNFLSPSMQAAYRRGLHGAKVSPETHRAKEMSPSLLAAHDRGVKETTLDWELGDEGRQEEEGRELLRRSNDGLQVNVGTPPLEVSSFDYSSSSEEQNAQLASSLDFEMMRSSEDREPLRRSNSPALEEGDARIAPMFGRAVDSEDLNREALKNEKRKSFNAQDGLVSPPPTPQRLHQEMGKKVHFADLSADSSLSSEDSPVTKRKAPATPRRKPSKPKTQLNNTNHGWLSYLKWPAIMAGLAYGAVRALDAAKLITVAAVSTVSAVAAGIAFVLTGIYQAWRESFKKSSFAGVSKGKNTVEELSDTLSKLPANEYQSFKNGVEGNKSIFNQFKSCFRPSDYSRSYYAGYHLAEREPNFDLNAVDNARKTKPSA